MDILFAPVMDAFQDGLEFPADGSQGIFHPGRDFRIDRPLDQPFPFQLLQMGGKGGLGHLNGPL